MMVVEPEQLNAELKNPTNISQRVRRMVPHGSRLSSPTRTEPTDPDRLAGIVHDLRLPLSHIKGFISTLRRTDIEWDAETRRDMLADIDIEIDRMADLIALLLERESSGMRGPEPVD